jgi:hypothetical protein
MAAKKVTEAGFRITGGLFFPLIPVDKFKQGDVALIEAVTGTAWDKWLRLLKKDGLSHALTKQGFLAVAIQRARDASVDDVVEFVNDLPLVDGITLEVPEDPQAKDEAGPTGDGETES